MVSKSRTAALLSEVKILRKKQGFGKQTKMSLFISGSKCEVTGGIDRPKKENHNTTERLSSWGKGNLSK